MSTSWTSARRATDRGSICERWLASTTRADNSVGPPDEGLSSVIGDSGERISLKAAVSADPVAIMGTGTPPPIPAGWGGWRSFSTTARACPTTSIRLPFVVNRWSEGTFAAGSS